MKSGLAIPVVILAFPLIVSADDTRLPCWDTAMTQAAMNDCADKELKAAEEELVSVYDEIRKQETENKVFLDRLKTSQEAWTAFRNAELGAIFPGPDMFYEYGSVYPMCLSEWKTSLTRERIKQLRRWLEGTIEGNVCRGSIPFKQESHIHGDRAVCATVLHTPEILKYLNPPRVNTGPSSRGGSRTAPTL